MNARKAEAGSRLKRRRFLLFATVGALVFALLAPESALARPLYRPDVFVRGDVGVKVYDSSGAGQIKVVKIHRGRGKTLYYWNRNMGSSTDSYTYWGCSGVDPFGVKWLDWQEADVTAEVVAGTYDPGPPALEPGWSSGMLHLRVKVQSSAAAGDHLTCLVLATSQGDGAKDAAGYRIRVIA